MELRDHQKKAVSMIYQSIREGKKRPVLGCCTSYGKTVIAGHVLKKCQDMGKRGYFFCDRVQLVKQSIDKFYQMGIDFGVKQANHPMTAPYKPIQIASIQTFAKEVEAHNGQLPPIDTAFVDECHTQYEIIKYLIKQYNDTIIIGMSASPYSRGLGLMYNNLLVPATASELLDLDYLCPVRYYVGKHIDMKKIASRGPNAFNPGDIDRETDNDSEMLSGDIIKNWVKLGENSQTIAFSPTQNMSKKLVEKFQAEGISAEHIDCYLDTDERRDLFEAHDKGEFKILSCSRLLNTGFDSPTTRCVIDCYPIKSVTDWVQRVGRILRISEGKEYAIYLDHGDNYSRFGPAEEIVPEELSMAKKGDTHNERDLTKEKKKPKTMECPQCRQAMIMPACKACGYQLPVNDQFYDDGTDLVEATGKAANKKDSIEIKTQFYSELLCHARKKGYSKGWAANQYRSKYDVWPNKIKPYDVSETTSLVKNWVKYQAIKYRASQQQRKAS